jgi:hypothetical protein
MQGGEGNGGSQPMSTAVHKIPKNLDLAPYLTYARYELKVILLSPSARICIDEFPDLLTFFSLIPL